MCKRLQPLNIQFAFQLISTKTIKKEHRKHFYTTQEGTKFRFGKRQPTHSNAAMHSNAAIQ